MRRNISNKFAELTIMLMKPLNSYCLRRQRYWDTPFAVQPQYLLPLQQLLSECNLVRQENQLLREHLLRAKADLENFRKRARKEREEIIERANELLMMDLLNVLDNCERGFKAGNEIEGPAKDILHGIKLSFDELFRVLGKYGLSQIEIENNKSFDPYYHEAVAIEHNKKLPDNQITEVVRTGYIYKGKVIRPA
ncbi:MAG: nucleotide exchange factor GrpE, partial [Candidatus Sumerlaeia bacterium]|nr:nucleotide exchange factor GrpE [Candidatus Sumerlaeia bacterium]